MKNIRIVFIVILTLSHLSSYRMKAQNTGIEKDYSSRAKTEILEKHKWLSFDVYTESLQDGIINWTQNYRVILGYDNNNPLIYVNTTDEFYKMCFLCTKNRIDIINTSRNELITYKNRHVFFDNYHSLGISDYVIRYFRYMGYYLIPMQRKMPIGSNVLSSADSCNKAIIRGIPYTVYYSSKQMISTQFKIHTTKINSYVNDENGLLDSIYTSQYLNQQLIETRTKIANVRFENKKAFLDSIFDYTNIEYANYTKHNGHNMPLSMAVSNNKIINNDVLNYPLVDLYNDTITLRQCAGWLLLNFWTITCGPCIKHLQEMQIEKDSLSMRILEKEDIKILAIEHMSDNMKLIGKVATQTESVDIIYSAKGIRMHISIPYLGYYYLVSPSKDIVFESSICDYDKIIHAKKEYEMKTKY